MPGEAGGSGPPLRPADRRDPPCEGHYVDAPCYKTLLCVTGFTRSVVTFPAICTPLAGPARQRRGGASAPGRSISRIWDSR